MKVFIENNIDILRATKSLLLYANDVCVNDIGKYGRIVSRDGFIIFLWLILVADISDGSKRESAIAYAKLSELGQYREVSQFLMK